MFFLICNHALAHLDSRLCWPCISMIGWKCDSAAADCGMKPGAAWFMVDNPPASGRGTTMRLDDGRIRRISGFIHHGGLGVLVSLACATAAFARSPAPSWPDTPAGRQAAAAALQALNADLLGHPSATLTLERWCGAHQLASPARVVARRVRGLAKPLPSGFRKLLAIGADEPVRYRRVQLACGDHVLSEADNWYLPNRLSAAMNRQLDDTDTPFGKVVQPLHFRRRTLSAELLWSPLPAGGATPAAAVPGAGTLVIPHAVLQHRALLYDSANRPFSALVETYTDQVLAFSPGGSTAGARSAPPGRPAVFRTAAGHEPRPPLAADPSAETVNR
jgi:hypothetical protein